MIQRHAAEERRIVGERRGLCVDAKEQKELEGRRRRERCCGKEWGKGRATHARTYSLRLSLTIKLEM
jgi:hypothetical protein